MTQQESLETFQSNVRRLFGHAFAKQVGKAKFSYSWKIASKRTVRDVVRPPEQVISGYAALVRGFMTNDDEWSLDRLPQVYHQIGASRFQQTKLKEYRKKIHRWQQWYCGVCACVCACVRVRARICRPQRVGPPIRSCAPACLGR
jgi:hypothetical protein